MIKILDKFTLTEKLVPLLSKIKTKEPAVMISVLAVYEAMSTKCEVEASESRKSLPLQDEGTHCLIDPQLRLSSSRNYGLCRSDLFSTSISSRNS